MMNERDCLYWAKSCQSQAAMWAREARELLDQCHACGPRVGALRRALAVTAQRNAAWYSVKSRELLDERERLLTRGAQ